MASMCGRASAIPVFAHRYGLSCQACHTTVPHLTAFGEIFLANGYRIRGLKPKLVFPAAVRVEINYASAGAADPDAIKGPLPKTIVNEVHCSSAVRSARAARTGSSRISFPAASRASRATRGTRNA
jgi:hypothetical protein